MYDELGSRAREELQGFLQQYPWDAFITATFARPANYPRLAIDRVGRALDNSLRAFVAAEPHRLGNWHAHGLVKFTSPRFTSNVQVSTIDYQMARAQARLARCGWSRVQPVREIGGVSGYLSKYVNKRSGDWELLGNWRRQGTIIGLDSK